MPRCKPVATLAEQNVTRATTGPAQVVVDERGHLTPTKHSYWAVLHRAPSLFLSPRRHDPLPLPPPRLPPPSLRHSFHRARSRHPIPRHRVLPIERPLRTAEQQQQQRGSTHHLIRERHHDQCAGLDHHHLHPDHDRAQHDPNDDRFDAIPEPLELHHMRYVF